MKPLKLLHMCKDMINRIRIAGFLSAVIFLFGILASFMPVRDVFADLEGEWEITENADTPTADKVEQVDVSNDEDAMRGQYVVKDGKTEQIPLDSRKGLKLVSKATGRDAEGIGFDFAAEQSGEFKLDFRVVSKHSTIGNLNSGGPKNDFDTIVRVNNAYSDIVRLVFNFTDAKTGRCFELNISGGGRHQLSSPRAYITFPGKEGYRARFLNDETGEQDEAVPLCTPTSKKKYYPTVLRNTSFSNSNAWYAMAGNAACEVKSSIIAFDPATMEVYAMSRAKFTDDAFTKTVILDLDSRPDMEGDEVYFKDAFKGGYKVQCKVAAMADNESKVKLTGTEPEAYDRYATMMIYSLNGKEMKTGDIADLSRLKLSVKDDKVITLKHAAKPPVPEADCDGEIIPFKGEITLKDPEGEPVDLEYGKFIPELEGDYTVVYYMLHNGLYDTLTVTLSSVDNRPPKVRLKDGLSDGQEYVFSDGFKLIPSADNLEIIDKESGNEGISVDIKVFDGDEAEVPGRMIYGMGKYRIEYRVADIKGNEVTLTRNICVTKGEEETVPDETTDKEEKKGCGGSLLSSGALPLLILASVFFFSSRKKRGR